MTNILLGIPSPFDFVLPTKYRSLLPCDKIIPKYYREDRAYKIIRDYFLEHIEYTYLAVACSDIWITPKDIQYLYEDAKHGYPVFGGIMNISLEQIDVYNVTVNYVDERHPKFIWYTKQTLPKKDVFPVGFSGFPLLCLAREIVNKFDFEPMSLYSNKPDLYPGSLDRVLCYKLNKARITILADKRINLLHLKEIHTQSQEVLVGIEKSMTEFWKYDASTNISYKTELTK